MYLARSTCYLLLIMLITLNLPRQVTGTEPSERCRLVPVKGACKAMIEKFYFNQSSKRCMSYFHDGCGPVVPFDSLEECRQLCENAIPPLKRRASGLHYDPQEDDPRYAEIFKTIDAEVDQALAQDPRRGSMGFVHLVWETKKRILLKKYNINWHSPAELNPQVMFD